MTGWQIVAVIGMLFVTVWAVIAVGVVAHRYRLEEKRIALESKRIDSDIHISDNKTKVALAPRDFFGRTLPQPRIDQGTDMPQPEPERERVGG